MIKHPLVRKLAAWLFEPLMTVALVVFATTALAQPFYIPSGSMEPTLQIGDALLGSKFAYGYSRWSLPYGLGPSSQTRLLGKIPKRGDIVIFRHPRNTGTTLIKRVVGLPGDRIQMVRGRLILNGVQVPLAAAGTGQVEEADGSWNDIDNFMETLPGGVKHAVFKRRWDGPLDNTQVYVVDRDPLPVEQLGHCKHRPDPHLVRLAARDRETDERTENIEPPLFGQRAVHDDDGRRAVGKLARIAGRDVATLAHGLEPCEPLRRGVGPVAFVFA